MITINNLIDALGNGKTATANTVFADLMSAKISAALDAKKVNMANQVYNGAMNKQETENVDVQTVDTESE